jgi:hypothetical protein
MLSVTSFPLYPVIVTLLPSIISKASPSGTDCAHNTEPAMKTAKKINNFFKPHFLRTVYSTTPSNNNL